VVNAAGLWAKQVGRMAGIELPVSPLSHHYLLRHDPEAALDEEMPMVVDLEGFTYLRQDLKGMLLGIYEINHQHWMMDGAPWDYGIELLQEDIDRIENELRLGFERFPVLQKVGVKQLGQRCLHLLAGRQPAGRAGARQARLLVRLRGDGGLPARRRRGQVAGGMDHPRRTGIGRVRHGCCPLRPLCREQAVHQARPRASSIPAAS
jgi:hypothetical protein